MKLKSTGGRASIHNTINNIGMKPILTLIVTSLFLAPISTNAHNDIVIKTTSAASDGHTENFCKNILFTSKLSKKKCQDVVFMEDKAKTVNFCQVAIVNKKSVKKCKKFKVAPTAYVDPKENIEVEEPIRDTTQGELIPGIESPLGYKIENYDRKGPIKYPNCKNLTYYINSNAEDEIMIKDALVYIESIFGYKLTQAPMARYIPGQIPASQEVRTVDIVIYVDYGTRDVIHFKDGQKSVGINVNSLGHDSVNGGWKIISSDVMLLSTEWYGNDKKIFREVILHEVGHTFGLGHPERYLDSNPIMGNLDYVGGFGYSSGDLAGAQLLKNDTSKCK
jgi:hypothetical protein